VRDPNHTRTSINIHTTEGAEFYVKFHTLPSSTMLRISIGDDDVLIYLDEADVDRFKQAIFKSLLVADEAKELVGETSDF